MVTFVKPISTRTVLQRTVETLFVASCSEAWQWSTIQFLWQGGDYYEELKRF